MVRRALSLLLVGCATTAPVAGPASGAEAVFFAEAWGECPRVFTGADAQALHGASARLAPTGVCRFEGVYVRGSQAIVVFATPHGKKAAAMLRPTQCVPQPSSTAVVEDPYVVDVAEGAKSVCPEAMEAIVEAVRAGTLPAPSVAQNPGAPAPPASPEPAPAPPAPESAAPTQVPSTQAPTGPAQP